MGCASLDGSLMVSTCLADLHAFDDIDNVVRVDFLFVVVGFLCDDVEEALLQADGGDFVIALPLRWVVIKWVGSLVPEPNPVLQLENTFWSFLGFTVELDDDVVNIVVHDLNVVLGHLLS